MNDRDAGTGTVLPGVAGSTNSEALLARGSSAKAAEPDGYALEGAR